MWQTLGHAWAVELLQRALVEARLVHAYLLVGPASIGKTTLAMDFARALNCMGPDPPCGVCSACHKIDRGVHPDVRVIRRAKDKTEIVIDQIRDLQSELALSPYEGRWRVAIVEGMHEANPNAANAFLKTLEEPPPQVVLLLTALTTEALLPTVVSRCQVLQLRPLSMAQVERALCERWGADADQAQLLARLSGGRIGWAVSALQDGTVLRRRAEMLEMWLGALNGDRVTRFAQAYRFSQRDDDLAQALDLWQSWWRDLLLVKSGQADDIANIDQRQILAAHAARCTLAQVSAYLQAIEETRRQLEQNVNARLALEVLMLKIPSLKQTREPAAPLPPITS